MAERVAKLAAEGAVVIFASNNDCPKSLTVTALLSELGMCPTVHELDKDPHGSDMERSLADACATPIPAVFIGGQLVGSSDEIMTLHLNGQLVPKLKGAGLPEPYSSEDA